MTCIMQSWRVAPTLFKSISSREKMPSNVEIKAKVKDFETFKNKAREVSGSEGTILDLMFGNNS